MTGRAGFPISQTVLAHPDIAGFLVHQSWDDLETAKGVFDWTHLDSELAAALANGKRVRAALHIGGDDAPKWLYDDPSIPFVLGKSGETFTYAGGLSFSGNTVSVANPDFTGGLPPGKMIEIEGTPFNDGRYRLTSIAATNATAEETFVSETNVSGTIRIDVVPCYWNSAVVQHKSDFYVAMMSHIQGLGSATEQALLGVSISMVDPNTGDWSFPQSAAHIASYNSAGWLTGNNAEKQAGLDVFESAMKQLYDNALPFVPAGVVAASAVGNVPGALLPFGTAGSEPANNILAHVHANFPGRLNLAKGALNARTNYARPCPATGTPWEAICANPAENFLQINWAASSTNVFKANGDHEWDQSNPLATATVLKNAAISAYAYNAQWFEIWHADVDGNTVLTDPALQSQIDIALAYGNDLFQTNVVSIGAPIVIQTPPPAINAPVGVEFVLQYVFDYNGAVPDLFEVKRNGLVVGTDLSHTISNPTPSDSGLYEISCRNSAGTTTVSTTITFQ